LGLDFGGVDIAWVEKGNKPYVLEVNTAPGLTDMTGDWYAKAFKDKYRGNP
jgi:D-alanine-D-alanine ligase-like ATP-grasp enzyme